MWKKVLAPLLIMLSMQTLQAFATEKSFYEGKHTLLCSVMIIRQCELDGCYQVESEEIDVPRHVLADFEKKRVTSTRFSGENNVTKIGSVTRKDNRLFLSGIDENSEAIEDALTWSMVVADPTGMMTLTIAAEEVAFVGFGSCVPVE